ncbi:MAG: hypothetical protein Ct9H90mP22_6430 [Gammaproteobacteria bacterium]|nr:MAG: hypothetical protein Ct9H90mP22_6430 [Gammaproteobacteria bacterium]
MQDGEGVILQMISNSLIEGEKLFSLIVLESLNQVKKFFEVKDSLG